MRLYGYDNINTIKFIDIDLVSSRPTQLNKTKKITKDILSEIKNSFIEVCKSE